MEAISMSYQNVARAFTLEKLIFLKVEINFTLFKMCIRIRLT